MSDDRHGIGGNRPPAEPEADPLITALEERHADLFDAMFDLELERGALPKAADIKTEEQAALITAAVGRVQALIRKAEKVRKEEGDDYLRAKQKVDGRFNALKRELTTFSDTINERLGPYLKAKAAEAEAKRQAELARQEAVAAAARAEEQARREAAAAAQAKAEEAAAAIRQAETDEARAAAAAALQSAEVERQEHTDAALEAAEEHVEATLQAETHSAVLAGARGKLAKTTAAGEGQTATSDLEWWWDWEITNLTDIRNNLGLLGKAFTEPEIRNAVQRLVNNHLEDAKVIPGLRLEHKSRVKTASRSVKPK